MRLAWAPEPGGLVRWVVQYARESASIVLTLTNNAALVITSITDRPEVPNGSGLRISADSDDMNSLNLAVAAQPTDGDKVMEDHGARIFLEPTANTLLDDMVLDADVDDQGGAQFFLAAQNDVPPQA
jgi:iron-sulfur cluster assembly protein